MEATVKRTKLYIGYLYTCGHCANEVFFMDNECQKCKAKLVWNKEK